MTFGALLETVLVAQCPVCCFDRKHRNPCFIEDFSIVTAAGTLRVMGIQAGIHGGLDAVAVSNLNRPVAGQLTYDAGVDFPLLK